MSFVIHITTQRKVNDMHRTGKSFIPLPAAGRYGIPADIIAQADRATLWALVCTAEALN